MTVALPSVPTPAQMDRLASVRLEQDQIVLVRVAVEDFRR